MMDPTFGLATRGRITMTDFIREHAGISDEVAFVGRGLFFQMWEPVRLSRYQAEVRARLMQLRQGLVRSAGSPE
jgi:MraZ protein